MLDEKTIPKRFYGVKEIQELFGIGRCKAIALMNTEGFPAIKLGRTYRVDINELEDWIKKNKGCTVEVMGEKANENSER